MGELFGPELTSQLRQYLSGLETPITIEFFPSGDDPASLSVDRMVYALADISPQVRIIRHTTPPTPIFPEMPEDLEGPITRISSMGIATGIRFLGIPAGQEFGPFLQSLISVSNQRLPKLLESTQDYLANINQPVHLQVFVTPM